MQKIQEGYWKNLTRTIFSVIGGLRLTGTHILNAFKSNKNSERLNIQSGDYFNSQKGITTLRYPHEKMQVPENGRYQLHNEIDDCIVCDKCVKVCPVNCIDIDPVRSPEEFGKTSDGTSKRIYAAKFEIDMSKCCFCGLCTTVCPTECLTMTPEYAFSTFSLKDHRFEFAEMTEVEVDQRKKEWQDYLATKEAAKTNSENTSNPPVVPKTAPKPVFRPMINPKLSKPSNEPKND